MFCFFHSQVHFIGASLHGTHREMAGPRFTSRARTIAGRVKHRPIWSGDPKDWSTFAFMLRAFFEQVGVQATATNNDDARKTSDEPTDVVAWADDNPLVFQLLTEMIDNKSKMGGTMLKQSMKKFPASGGMPGDDSSSRSLRRKERVTVLPLRR